MRDDIEKLGLELNASHFQTITKGDRAGEFDINKDFAIYVVKKFKWHMEIEVQHINKLDGGGIFAVVKVRVFDNDKNGMEREMIPGVASASSSEKEMRFSSSIVQKATTFAIKNAVKWNLGLDTASIQELAHNAGATPNKATQRKYNAMENADEPDEVEDEEVDLGGELEV
jgi:hypothetical protein